MAMKIPSGTTMIRAAFLTMFSLAILRGIGGLIPQLKGIPFLGASFQ